MVKNAKNIFNLIIMTPLETFKNNPIIVLYVIQCQPVGGKTL